MALISCPECEKQVSDKAVACPHCGYPLAEPLQRELGHGVAERKTADKPSEPPQSGQTHEDIPNALKVKRRVAEQDFWCNPKHWYLDVVCPICGLPAQASIHQRGQTVCCPHCERDFRVPTAADIAGRGAEAPARQSATATEGARTHKAPSSARYDGFAIAGFVLGLVAFLLTGYELPIVPLLAVIFSSIGLSRTARAKRKGRTIAVLGLVLGLLFLVVAILVITGAYKP